MENFVETVNTKSIEPMFSTIMRDDVRKTVELSKIRAIFFTMFSTAVENWSFPLFFLNGLSHEFSSELIVLQTTPFGKKRIEKTTCTKKWKTLGHLP